MSAALQHVQQVLHEQPLRVHRLGTQQSLAQSPAVQAIAQQNGLSFLNVSDKDILRLTRPSAAYRQCVQQFEERFGDALQGRLKVCFLTNENLPDGLYPMPLRRLLNGRGVSEITADLRSNKATHSSFGRTEGVQYSVVTVEYPRGSVGNRMMGLSDENEPYSMAITHSKLLRSRKLFLTAQMAHELGHGLDEALDVVDYDNLPEDYGDHLGECYADSVSVYVTAQLEGRRGLNYVAHDCQLRTLSLQNDVEYYTSPVMAQAIAHAQTLLEKGDLQQMTLDDIAAAAKDTLNAHAPSLEAFEKLKAEQQAFVAEIDARNGDIEQVQHPFRHLCSQAWDTLAEEFETPISDDRSELLTAYLGEVSQSLRGYGSREKQLEALTALHHDLNEEADLNQQLFHRDDVALEDLSDGELQIAERRHVLERIRGAIDKTVERQR